MCGACNDTHGKTKSGSCIDCSPRGVHIATALVLSLWSIAIIAIVLRRALSYGESGDITQKDDKKTFSYSIAQADQGAYSNNIAKEIKGESKNTEDAPRSTKKEQHSKSAGDIVESLEAVASLPTRKSYVSEIAKVGNMM